MGTIGEDMSTTISIEEAKNKAIELLKKKVKGADDIQIDKATKENCYEVRGSFLDPRYSNDTIKERSSFVISIGASTGEVTGYRIQDHAAEYYVNDR